MTTTAHRHQGRPQDAKSGQAKGSTSDVGRKNADKNRKSSGNGTPKW
ncbi:hypothetical protein [Streptomyces noursei]|nr:hypothetical protein [Streptomyces noursei]MCZ1014886.1 hypothetical protein [Streptomyces noursei]GGX49885.1 hypothetical protein GCM10010341_84450 [Streptomyces noursei]